MGMIDPFDLKMSLLLDDLLDEAEASELRAEIRNNPASEDAFERMRVVDTMLRSARHTPAPIDFAAAVMDRIDAYETQRQWTPWLIAVLAISSVLAAVSVLGPVLFVGFGWYEGLLALPAVAETLAVVTGAIDAVSWALTWVVSRLINRIVVLPQDPASLAVVITALTVAATYIGVREGQRTLALTTN